MDEIIPIVSVGYVTIPTVLHAPRRSFYRYGDTMARCVHSLPMSCNPLDYQKKTEQRNFHHSTPYFFIFLSSFNTICVMCLKQCHKSPMTGNGSHTTYKNGDDWGMVYDIVLTTLPHFRSGFKMGKSAGNLLQLLTIFVHTIPHLPISQCFVPSATVTLIGIVSGLPLHSDTRSPPARRRRYGILFL